MTVNPIKLIREKREFKAYLQEEAAILRDNRVRMETIEWMMRENKCTPRQS